MYMWSAMVGSYGQAKHSHYTVHGLVLPSDCAAPYMSRGDYIEQHSHWHLVKDDHSLIPSVELSQ